MSVRKGIIVVCSIVAVIFIISMFGKMFETNEKGYYRIKQAAISGTMSIRMKPGVYWQGWGRIDVYKAVATVGFGKQKGEGSADIDAVDVIFTDGSKAKISGLVRVRLPVDLKKMMQLKQEYFLRRSTFMECCYVIYPHMRNFISRR